MTSESRTLAFLAATLLLASGDPAKAFENPVVERYAAPPAGFTWTESRRNTGTFGRGEEAVTFKVGERRWRGSHYIAFESALGTLLADANGGWVARLATDGKLLSSWDPPLSLPHPLEVSKAWTHTHRVTDAEGMRETFDLACRIENYGEVIVPAGSFRAFEIRCRDSRGLNMTIWHDPSLGIWVKSSLSAGGSGEKHSTRDQQLLSVSDGR